MSLPLLDAAIGTRLHSNFTGGSFDAHVVECQGRSPLAFTSTSVHVTSQFCVVLIASVCGGRCDSGEIRLASAKDIESYAGDVIGASLHQITSELTDNNETVDWRSVGEKADSIVQHPYLGVTLTVLLVQNKNQAFSGTLFQMGATVDVWHLSSDDETVCRLTSRTGDLLEVPRVAPVLNETLRDVDLHSERTRKRTALAYLPVSRAFGARAFKRDSRDRFSVKCFSVSPNSWLILHSNGFRFAQTTEEQNKDIRVADWLPSRLHRYYATDAQFDRNLTEVLDHEMLQSLEQSARNRSVVVIVLSDSEKPFSSRSHIRAGRYVPNNGRRFETAFARHCMRLGADKLKMIALFNEQSGAMAGSDSKAIVRHLQDCDNDNDEHQDDDNEHDTDHDDDEEQSLDSDIDESDKEVSTHREIERNKNKQPHGIDCECSECEDDDVYGWRHEPYTDAEWQDE